MEVVHSPVNSWPEWWTRLVRQQYGQDAELVAVRFFASKKNQVSLLTIRQGPVVRRVLVKYHVWSDAAHEYSVLSRAHMLGLPVPKPLGLRGRVMFCEPVEVGHSVRVCTLGDIGHWLGQFHRLMREPKGLWVRGDCVTPNFVSNLHGVVYGLDFEEAHIGHPYEDLAELVTCLVTKPHSISGKQLDGVSSAWPLAASILEGYLLGWADQWPDDIVGFSSPGLLLVSVLVEHIVEQLRFRERNEIASAWQVQHCCQEMAGWPREYSAANRGD